VNKILSILKNLVNPVKHTLLAASFLQDLQDLHDVPIK